MDGPSRCTRPHTRSPTIVKRFGRGRHRELGHKVHDYQGLGLDFLDHDGQRRYMKRDIDALGTEWACWVDLLGKTCLLIEVRLSSGSGKSLFNGSLRHNSSRAVLAAWVHSVRPT